MLGLLRSRELEADPALRIEQAMRPGPSTFRPFVAIEEVAKFMTEHDLESSPVTTSDGRLLGLLMRQDASRAAEGKRAQGLCRVDRRGPGRQSRGDGRAPRPNQRVGSWGRRPAGCLRRTVKAGRHRPGFFAGRLAAGVTRPLRRRHRAALTAAQWPGDRPNSSRPLWRASLRRLGLAACRPLRAGDPPAGCRSPAGEWTPARGPCRAAHRIRLLTGWRDGSDRRRRGRSDGAGSGDRDRAPDVLSRALQTFGDSSARARAGAYVGGGGRAFARRPTRRRRHARGHHLRLGPQDRRGDLRGGE